ncbi:MAG: hypothetical protein JEZ02_20355 [Desulfatibacillum sp.]|nr:hypothetical protein [Desulfatibacillum sp.]
MVYFYSGLTVLAVTVLLVVPRFRKRAKDAGHSRHSIHSNLSPKHTVKEPETEARVLLQTNKLAALDPANEPGIFQILDFKPGMYTIPYSAIQADDNGPIDVDSSTIFFVDAQYLEQFCDWFHKTGNEVSYDVCEIGNRLKNFNIEFSTMSDFILSEGLNTCFPGEGRYTLDLVKLRLV